MMNELSLLNTLLDDDFGLAFPSVCAGAATSPDVDVRQTSGAYTLEMDLPGMSENDVELNLKEGVLTIASVKAGETKDKTEEKEEGTWILRERRRYEFKRTFTLPKDVDCDAVTASFKNGVLTISMPRKAEEKAKKIAITAA